MSQQLNNHRASKTLHVSQVIEDYLSSCSSIADMSKISPSSHEFLSIYNRLSSLSSIDVESKSSAIEKYSLKLGFEEARVMNNHKQLDITAENLSELLCNTSPQKNPINE
jgi:hypothetical protein